MKQDQPTKPFEKSLDAFKKAIQNIGENATDAGRAIVAMLDERADAFEIILSKCEWVTLPFLEALERVGRGMLDPFFLLDQSPVSGRVISEGLTVKDQKTIKSGYLPVAIKVDGGVKVENMKMEEINFTQAQLVIGEGRIRSANEQIEILKSREAARAARSLRYEILGNKVHFYADSDFTWEQLESIVEQIKPKAIDIESSVKERQIKKV